MKKIMTLGLAFAVLFGTFALVAYATGGKGHHEEGSYNEAMKDVKVEVTDTAEGVIVKVSSNKPEVVKLIQEHWAKHQEAHKTGNHSHGHESGEDHSH